MVYARQFEALGVQWWIKQAKILVWQFKYM